MIPKSFAEVPGKKTRIKRQQPIEAFLQQEAQRIIQRQDFGVSGILPREHQVILFLPRLRARERRRSCGVFAQVKTLQRSQRSFQLIQEVETKVVILAGSVTAR